MQTIPDTPPPEFPQKFIDMLGNGDEEGFPQQFTDIEFFVLDQDVKHILYIEDADNVVYGLLVYRKPGMAAFADVRQKLVPGGIYGYEHRIYPGDHDFLDGGFRQFYHSPNHFLLIRFQGIVGLFIYIAFFEQGFYKSSRSHNSFSSVPPGMIGSI
jgi:hypothetical protein